MPILYGAVAYREDAADKHEEEIDGWGPRRIYKYPIACPKGNSCDKTYLLIVEINASDESAKEYVDQILKTMDRECPNHVEVIRTKPAGVQ